MEETKPQIEQLPEAPASVNYKIKSPAGFEYMFTMRSERASTLQFRMAAMEKHWLEAGFVPLPQYAPRSSTGFAQRPIDYVVGRTCPKDDARIVQGIGKIKEKCENYKFDMTTKKSVGTCDYIVWN